MSRHIAPRVSDISPFEVMDVLARAQQLEAAGRSVVHMEIGEPDFSAPDAVVEAGARALRGGLSHYTSTLGLAALREAIAAHYGRRFGRQVSPARVAITAGASGALLVVVALWVGPGDEVLVPDPGYPGYRHFVRAFEGVAAPLRVSAAAGFQPTLEDVRRAWRERTVGVLLGTPSNPSGTLLERAELERIAAFVAERGGVLIVDEIYQGLVYGRPPDTALDLPGEVVLINSFSKYFCMTGWRLGWAVLPEARVRDFEKLAQHLYICAPTPAQHAALAAFLPESIATLEARRLEFERRRDFLVPALERAGLRVPARPNGAFYVYADCGASGLEATEFTLALLDSEGVAATPGVDFGANDTRRYVRFAYTQDLAAIQDGARRIARFLGRRA